MKRTVTRRATPGAVAVTVAGPALPLPTRTAVATALTIIPGA